VKCLKKMTIHTPLLAFLLGSIFTTTALSEDSNKSQTLASEAQEEMSSKRAFTAIPTETPQREENADTAPAERVKAEDKPKESAPEVRPHKKHKHALHKAKPKEKPKHHAPKAKDASATPQDKKAAPLTSLSGHKGWFVGLRGAYVPAGILEIGYEFNETFKLRLLGELGRYKRNYSVDGQRYDGRKSVLWQTGTP
jgi:hypothetical protein